MEVKLALCNFDIGAASQLPAEDYFGLFIDTSEKALEQGASILLFPEFAWAGCTIEGQNFSEEKKAFTHLIWKEWIPKIAATQIDKTSLLVLGTAPYFDSNTNQLFNRSIIINGGKVHHQDKLCLTPWENEFTPGSGLHLLDFQGLRIAVLICLDIEMPELAVLLKRHQPDILLVPSATESQMGVERIHRCASARAVELCCYVGVAQLLGKSSFDLLSENIGYAQLYQPAQGLFANTPQTALPPIETSGFSTHIFDLELKRLRKTKALSIETNPSQLHPQNSIQVHQHS